MLLGVCGSWDAAGCTAPARDAQGNGTSRPPPSGLHGGPAPEPGCRPRKGLWVPPERKQSRRHRVTATAPGVTGPPGRHARPGILVPLWKEPAEVRRPVPPAAQADGVGGQAASQCAGTPQDAPLETHTPQRSAETRAEGAAALRVPKSVRQVADGHGTAPRGPGAGPRLTLTWPCDLGPASSPLWAQFLPLRIFAGRLF